MSVSLKIDQRSGEEGFLIKHDPTIEKNAQLRHGEGFFHSLGTSLP